MKIVNTIDAAQTDTSVSKPFSLKTAAVSNERNTPNIRVSNATFNNVNDNDESAPKVFQNLLVELDRKGMEVSFSVDPAVGFAQMVVVESGTGREVLKVPSDSTLYQALKDQT
jgi:uncharacterized FlaG/YvyC family protein